MAIFGWGKKDRSEKHSFTTLGLDGAEAKDTEADNARDFTETKMREGKERDKQATAAREAIAEEQSEREKEYAEGLKREGEKWHQFQTIDIYGRERKETSNEGAELEWNERIATKAGKAGLWKNITRAARATALVGLSYFPGHSAVEAAPVQKGKAAATAPEKRREAKVETVAGTKATGSKEETKNLGMDFPLLTIHNSIQYDKDGNFSISDTATNILGKALMPANIHWTNEQSRTLNINGFIPMEWAQKFEADKRAGKTLEGTDLEKAKQEIAKQIKEQYEHELKMWLTGWDNISSQEQAIKEGHPGNKFDQLEDSKQIESIVIRGVTSPEASTPDSIRKGNLDSGNLKLGEVRAQTGAEIVKKVLMDKGWSEADIDQKLKLESAEADFTDEDYEVLDQVCKDLGIKGSDKFEQYYNLLQQYNRGEIKDAAVNEALDAVVAAKRQVEFEINLKDNKKETKYIPIPFLLFLTPALLLLKKRKKKEENGTGVDGTETTPPKVEETRTSFESEIAEYIPKGDPIWATRLGDPSSEQYQLDEENVVLKDIGINYDNTETVKYGIDYEAVAYEIWATWDKFKDPDTREAYFAKKLLMQWETADKNSGRITPDRNYLQEPHQVYFARMHSRVLIEAVIRIREHAVVHIEATEKNEAWNSNNPEMVKKRLSGVIEVKEAEMETRETARQIKKTATPKQELAVQGFSEEMQEKIANTQLPDKNSEEYKRMKYETYVNDLEANFNKSETKGTGIDYEQLTEVIYDEFYTFPPPEENDALLLHASGLLMRLWTEKDIAQKISEGVSREDAQKEYEERDKASNQIQYAKMHAQAIIDLVKRVNAVQKSEMTKSLETGDVKSGFKSGFKRHHTDFIRILEHVVETDEDIQEYRVEKIRGQIREA